jgi:hypothetical protein
LRLSPARIDFDFYRISVDPQNGCRMNFGEHSKSNSAKPRTSRTRFLRSALAARCKTSRTLAEEKRRNPNS